jgi:hypothetical protein
MAQNMRSEAPAKTHNQTEMMAAIRQLDKELVPLEASRTEINTEIKNKKRRLKDFGISVKYFDAIRALHRMDDEDDLNEAIDNIRIVAKALHVGGQGGLFPDENEIASARNAASDEDDDTDLDAIRSAGFEAGEEGKNGTDNPHDEGNLEHAAWHEGWMEVQTKRVEKLDAGAKGKAKATH